MRWKSDWSKITIRLTLVPSLSLCSDLVMIALTLVLLWSYFALTWFWLLSYFDISWIVYQMELTSILLWFISFWLGSDCTNFNLIVILFCYDSVLIIILLWCLLHSATLETNFNLIVILFCSDSVLIIILFWCLLHGSTHEINFNLTVNLFCSYLVLIRVATVPWFFRAWVFSPPRNKTQS